jgi:hypothetical protein
MGKIGILYVVTGVGAKQCIVKYGKIQSFKPLFPVTAITRTGIREQLAE